MTGLFPYTHFGSYIRARVLLLALYAFLLMFIFKQQFLGSIEHSYATYLVNRRSLSAVSHDIRPYVSREIHEDMSFI